MQVLRLASELAGTKRIRRVAAVCGTARVHPYNKVFLLSLEAALKADRRWIAAAESFCGHPADGLRTFARIYAGWGVGEEFYRTEAYLKLGYVSVEVRSQ